jgi:CoA:oxalate CoA-transferase
MIGEGAWPMTVPALDGIRVLELGQAIAAPHCAQILGDQGAQVIRVEPPGGDRTRGALPVADGDSVYFAAHNRGKRSVILDLKAPRGKQAFLDLADASDVVITNYSAGVPDRLGIGYAALSARNQRIVFVHITGFGAEGGGRDFGAYDGIIQSMSGIPWLSGEPGGPPVLAGAFVADQLAAMQGALGAVLALHRRQVTGTGAFVPVSMLEGYMTALAHHAGEALDLGEAPAATRNRVPTAFANTFPAADGHVYLAPLAPRAWQGFCALIGAPPWLADSDANWRITEGRDKAEEHVAAWTATRTRADIITQMRGAGVPCGPVNDVAEAIADPVHHGRDPLTTVIMRSGRQLHVPGPEVRLGGPPDSGQAIPAAGQHTTEVLAELGYRDEDIAALLADGVAETELA